MVVNIRRERERGWGTWEGQACVFTELHKRLRRGTLRPPEGEITGVTPE